jgi:hypothetical protein
MKPNEIVHSTSVGKAYYKWTDGKGVKHYLIKFKDGRTLWTNSMDIIKDELKEKEKTNDNQLDLF